MMAVEQTLTSSARNFLLLCSTPSPPIINSQISHKYNTLSFPINSPPSHLSLFSLSSNLKTKSPETLFTKCSSDYNNNSSSSGYYDSRAEVVVGPQYPRPQEIQWKKELCNSVQLIGIVAAPVQIKQLVSGKVVAWSRLAVKKSATDTAWINLTFWDELALVASQHIEKGNQIYVSGRLVSDTVESEDGKQQTYYKVVVQQLNFIERSLSPVSLYDGDSSPETTGKKNYAVNTTGSTQDLWQAYFANPMEWWDNRKDKRNPKYPDFKHKDTGEALWVEGRTNPWWVKSELAKLDLKMESSYQQNDETMANYASF